MWFFVEIKSCTLNLKTTCILFLQFLVWQNLNLCWHEANKLALKAVAISEVEIVTFTHGVFDMWTDYLSILEG